MNLRTVTAILVLCACPLLAQLGNGGNGDLDITPMAINANITLTVTGGANQPFALFLSDAPASLPSPFGTISIDYNSPAFAQFFSGNLSPAGTAAMTVFMPNDPNLLNALLFIQGAVIDPTYGPGNGVAITRAIRIDFENGDSFTPLPPLAAPRALGTGDALKDGRVFVAGGGSGGLLGPVASTTTELYEPYTRSWSSGPALVGSRAFHASAVLADGRVLLTGGVGPTGAVNTSCELFDPVANTMTAVAPMGTPRAGHTATTLPNGKVLVTGGTNNFTPGGTPTAPLYGPIFNGSQNTGEVYDPAANTWTACANTMSNIRLAHSATLLPTGNVMVAFGINGSMSLAGQDLPTFTGTTSIYNPTTNSFTNGPTQGTPRAAHRATLMSNGEVFISGGLVAGTIFQLFIPQGTNSCAKCASPYTSWTSAGAVPGITSGPMLHGQVLLKNGKCHLSGGAAGSVTSFTATSICATRVAAGTSLTATAVLPDARGTHLAVRLFDGSVLIAGGTDSTNTAVATTLLYTPVP